MKKPTRNEIRDALFDVLDGQSKWYEIKEKMCCSDQRSMEIEGIFEQLLKEIKLDRKVG